MIRHLLARLPIVGGVVLGGLVLWAPLPFGSVRPVAETAVIVGSCLALLLAVPAIHHRRSLAPVALPAAALAGLALLAALQAVPWPAWVAAAVSPEHARLAAAAGELAASVEGVEPRGGVPLTLAPEATRDAVLSFAALAAALLAAGLAGRSRHRRRWLAAAVLAAAAFQVLYGVRHLVAGSTEIWGIEPVASYAGRLRGTFVNPNHVAYLLETALMVAVAAAWWGWTHARREASLERRLLLAGPPALVVVPLLGALVLTASRAGLAAAAAGIAAQGVLLATGRRRRRWLPVAVLAALAGLGLAAVVLLERLPGRLLAVSTYSVSLAARLEVAGQALALWWRFPLLGAGAGSFREAFELVRREHQWNSTWNHAHNDFAELAATLGAVGVAVFAVGLGALVLRLGRVLRQGRRSEERAGALAALGALAAAAVHESFDFGLLLPANALVLAVVCGAAAAGRLLRPGEVRRRRRLRAGQGGQRGDAHRPGGAAADGDELDQVEPRRQLGEEA